MKSLTLALASLLFITFTVNAQNNIKKTPKLKYTKQLCWEFGGDISYSNTTYHYETTGSYNSAFDITENIFSVGANAGIFVVKGLKLGIEPNVTYSKFGDGKTTRLGLYFAQEYVIYTKSIVYPYIGGAIGYTSQTFTNYVGENPTQDGFSWGAKAGMKINFFGNSLLNFGFTFYRENYNYTNTSPFSSYESKNHYDRFGLKLGWSVFF